MKHLFSVLVVALCLLTACGDKGDGSLSTDLVTNPKSASEKNEKQAAITFEKTEFDFGSVLQGEVVTCSFRFSNTGNAPLLISEVGTSCGCTVGEYPKEPIAPGKTGQIKITYDSKGHHGIQSKSLVVNANTNPSQTILRIKAEVRTPEQL